jgi:hypothetical protein
MHFFLLLEEQKKYLVTQKKKRRVHIFKSIKVKMPGFAGPKISLSDIINIKTK